MQAKELSSAHSKHVPYNRGVSMLAKWITNHTEPCLEYVSLASGTCVDRVVVMEGSKIQTSRQRNFTQGENVWYVMFSPRFIDVI